MKQILRSICQLAFGLMCFAAPFVQSATASIVDMQFFDASHGWYLTKDGQIYQYDADDNRWHFVSQVVGESFTHLYFHTPAEGFVLHRNRVFTTTDSGHTWAPMPGSDAFSGNGHWTDLATVSGELWVVGSWLYIIEPWEILGVLQWWERGQSELSEQVVPYTLFHGITGLPSRTIFLAGSHYNQRYGGAALFRNQSPGDTAAWEVVYQDSTEEHLIALSFPDSVHGWAGGTRGLLLATRDGGTTWRRQDVPVAADISVVQFVDSTHGWARGGAHALLRTENGGQQWDTLQVPFSPSNPHSVNTLSVLSPDTVWVGGDTLLRTVDGGRSWEGYQVTAVKTHSMESVSQRIHLHQNYPNPFNTETTIEYELPAEQKIQMGVYDIRGRLISRLYFGWKNAGVHRVTWRATHASSGLYFICLQSRGQIQVRRTLLLK